jgi:putative ABC transport system permease protein
VTLLLCLRIALRAIRLNVLRSALTMLGIIIGVSAVIATMSVGAGAQAEVMDPLRRLGANLLIVLPGSVSSGGVRLGTGTKASITEDDATAIAREIPLVEAAAPSVWPGGCCQVVYRNMNWWTATEGTTPAFREVRQWPVVAGRYFTRDEVATADKVVLLGQTVATNLFGNRNPVGETVRVGQVPLTVLGLLATKGPNPKGQDQDDVILLPITTVTKRVIGPQWVKEGAVHAITIKVRDGADLEAAEHQVRRLLRQRHQLQTFQDDDFRVRNPTEMLQAEEESTRILTILLGAIASVSLLVGGIGIMNIMLVSVTERSREIGIRMAVGARPADIRTQFLVEALTLALIGGLVGVGLGMFGSHAISYLARWRTVVRVDAILLAFGFAGGVGIFFGLYPARKASTLNPIEALRYE